MNEMRSRLASVIVGGHSTGSKSGQGQTPSRGQSRVDRYSFELALNASFFLKLKT